jgi:hypothetical protein
MLDAGVRWPTLAGIRSGRIGAAIRRQRSIMPFKSKAQRRKFAELLLSGKITPEQYERWNRETGRAELPEHVKPKRTRKAVKTRGRARKPKPRSREGRNP